MPSEIPTKAASGLAWMASALTSAPMLSAVTAVAPIDRVLASRWMKRWCALQQQIFGLDLEIEDRNGCYDSPPYLFVHLNQASLSEAFVKPLLLPVPYRIVINFEFAMLPFLGPATIAMGSRVIVRQWPAQAKRRIDQAIEDLRRGDSYLISIEGRRSPDGHLQPYKRGAAVMAIRSGATVVPFVTLDAHARLPYGSWQVRPGTVRGILCKSIPTTGMTLDDRHVLTETLRTIAETELAAHRG